MNLSRIASTTAECLLVALVLVAPRAGLCGQPGPYSHFEAMLDKRIADGDEHYEKGEYGFAIDAYLDAWEIVPLPELLGKVATCYRAIGQTSKAELYYRMYLALRVESGEEVPEEDLVDAFLAEDEEKEEKLERHVQRRSKIQDLAPYEQRTAMMEMLVSSFISGKAWRAGHSISVGTGLAFLATHPAMIRIGIAYGNEIVAGGQEDGGHMLVLDALVSVLLPGILGGRIVFSAGAITQYRNVWTDMGKVRIVAMGASLHGRFHFRERAAFVIEADACPLLLFGATDRSAGFEIVVRGGFSFGL